MSDELSKRELRSLAESNVGLLSEVREAIELLQALEMVLKRAQWACRTGEKFNAAKSASDGDEIADETAGEMGDAAAKFRVISSVIEDMNRYM